MSDERARPRAVGAPRSPSRSTRRWKRLQVEYVDLYQAHRFDAGVDDRGDDRGVAAGRRRRQGPLPRLQRMDTRADRGGVSRSPDRRLFVSSQPQYSMLWRAPEDEVLPAVRGERHLPDRLVTARPGRAGAASTSPGQPHPSDSRAASEADELSAMLIAGRRQCARGRPAAGCRSPTGAGLKPSRDGTRVGSAAQASSPRRSPAPPAPSRCTPMRPPRGSRLSTDVLARDRRSARRRADHGPDARTAGDRGHQAPRLSRPDSPQHGLLRGS